MRTLSRIFGCSCAVLPMLVAACGAADHSGGAPLGMPTATAPQPSASAAPAPPVVPGHSIDLSAMDRSISPGTDFFMFGNGGWYAKATIPDDRTSAGVGLRVSEEVEARTHGLLEEAAQGKAPEL